MSGSFADQVVEMAALVGLEPVERGDGTRLRIRVPQDDGQDVSVFVRSCGEMHGKEVLEFSSDGLPLPSEDAAKMPLLILALQRNADVLLGHWALDELDEGSVLRVFHSQIGETMDPPELRGAVLAVADEYAMLTGAIAG